MKDNIGTVEYVMVPKKELQKLEEARVQLVDLLSEHIQCSNGFAKEYIESLFLPIRGSMYRLANRNWTPIKEQLQTEEYSGKIRLLEDIETSKEQS